MEEWWLKYAYLQNRESLVLSTNFAGNWIPVGNPLHERIQEHATDKNIRAKSITCIIYQLCRYWTRLRNAKLMFLTEITTRFYLDTQWTYIQTD